MKRLSVDDLTYTWIRERFDIERASVDESVVKLAIQPWGTFEDPVEEAKAVFRTGILFVLSEEALDAVSSSIETRTSAEQTLGGLPLPPLPLKRMLIEFRAGDHQRALRWTREESVLMLGIGEFSRGRKWSLCAFYIPHDDDRELTHMTREIGQ